MADPPATEIRELPVSLEEAPFPPLLKGGILPGTRVLVGKNKEESWTRMPKRDVVAVPLALALEEKKSRIGKTTSFLVVEERVSTPNIKKDELADQNQGPDPHPDLVPVVPVDPVAAPGVPRVIVVAKAKTIIFIPNGAIPVKSAVEETPAINPKREDAILLALRSTRNRVFTLL